MTLVPPDQQSATVRGTVVGHGPLGFEVRMLLTPDTRKALTKAAELG